MFVRKTKYKRLEKDYKDLKAVMEDLLEVTSEKNDNMWNFLVEIYALLRDLEEPHTISRKAAVKKVKKMTARVEALITED